MVLQSPSSSSSSFSYRFTYQVFLSFRGTDTRYSFTGNLFNALNGNGIHTFIDDRELHGGDEITPSLFKAIENSRIFIPVFSINYASSSFCLDELVHIMECSKEKGHLVLPVFYGVDPSHVRHQTATKSYGKALVEHEEKFQKNKEKYADNMKRLQKWKMALEQAANLSGYHFKIGNEYEHKFIGNIIKYVSNKINRVPLHVADYPVGLESRVLHVAWLLNERSDDGVHIIGIHGIGGVGKTTLAKAIYNSLADQFECLCFLHNVRENSAKHLQEMLLSKTVGLDIKLGDVSEGISIIKQRLNRKKVLLILDDVDKLQQLKVMAGGIDWFGFGSKVIITTRDKHLLASHGIKRTYEVVRLNAEEALDLLRWNAFKNNEVDSSYEDILNRAVTYASGLPLALEVVGSNLFGKLIGEWTSTLDWYERVPDKKIQEILKVSFDALGEYEQSVFLDIACCFKGLRLAEVEDILHAHYGYCMKHQIRVLVEKSLIKICLGYVTTFHDLIEDMGKEIVRQESPKEPGKCSRLWFHKDIIEVLEDSTGTSEIEIIYLDFPSIEATVDWNGKAFEKMTNLKTLIIKNGHFFEGPRHFPSSLKVLEWHRYPSQCMPPNFHPKKLAICKLPNSCFTSSELTSVLNKNFVNLKVLNFDDCEYLTHIPDVSGLNQLEEFSFQVCVNLTTIHHSVGLLNRLKTLNAMGCLELRSFPPMKLTALQDLSLSYCVSLERFPEIIGEMENLTTICISNTSIEELPFSFQNLTQLSWIYFGGSGVLMLPSNILMMPTLSGIAVGGCLSSMETFHLERCDCLSDEFLPKIVKLFANVTYLNLSKHKFTILPECLKECHSLKFLYLSNCWYLREIKGIPPNLEILDATDCKSLTSSCKSMLMNQELHEAGDTLFCFAGTERIPEWFEHQSKGPSISFWFRNEFPSIAIFHFWESTPSNNNVYLTLEQKLFFNGKQVALLSLIDDNPMLVNHTYIYDMDMCLQDDILYMGKTLFKNEWIHAEIRHVIKNKHGNEVMIPIHVHMENGIHVFEDESSMEDIQFTNPYEEKRKLDEVWVKVNCDVAVSHESNATACGGILRDQLGSFLGGFAGQLGEIPILHAELKAILYGIQFAWNRGYRKVIVESDCPYAIELLRKECPPDDVSCWNLVREIHIFSSSAGEVVCSHTSSERNWAANGFAKHGLELSWNQGLVIFDDFTEMGIPILKQKSSMEDIQFTNPLIKEKS